MKNERTIKKMSAFLHSLDLTNPDYWESIPRTLEGLYNLMYEDVKNSNHIWALKNMRSELLNKSCNSNHNAKHLISIFDNYCNWYIETDFNN